MKKLVILLSIFLLGTNVFALDYNVYKLDDGQTVIIKQVKNNPIVTIDTWIKTGSINENDKNNGVSHFLEHLFFKGTKTHPAGDFDKILESKGAITNAATSKDFTHYYITIPSKYFDLAMDLHADMLLHPLVPRKELEKERKVVLEEIAKNQNNPTQKVYDNLNKMLYKTHPYKRKVLGTTEIIGKISRKEILNYYTTHYGPQNMITIVIGDVEPQHALEKIKKDFKTTPRKIIKNINKPEKQIAKQIIKIDYQPVQSSYMLMGFKGVDAFSKDTYALDVLATILGEGRSSILYQSIKERKQLVNSISASNSTFKEDGLFIVSANFNTENVNKLQKEIFKEIANVQKFGVTSEQLKLAQNVIEKDTYFSRESTSNIASEIGYTTVLTDNPKYYDEYLGNIKKVTLKDVKRVAKKYLSENRSAISIVLPRKAKKFQQSSTHKTKQVKHSAKLIKETISTKKYKLDNGLTLLITPNKLNDIVAITVSAKGGYFLEKIAGTANIMGSVMLKGTKKYSSLELAKIMEENGINISPSASPDIFTISILTTKSQLPKAIDILNEIVNNATFSDYEIEKTKALMLNSIKKSRDIPMNIALEEYKSLLYENSVYSNGSKLYEKTLSKIQKKDILKYYNTIFNPKNIVISVDGNIDITDITNQLNFNVNKTTNLFNYNNYASSICPLTIPKAYLKKIPNLKTAWIILGWQVSGVLNKKNNATLQLIDTILGSGMSSRLFRNVRDKEGLAYQLGSSYSPKMLRGAFTLYIGTNPKTVVLARKKMLAEITKIKTEFVSDKELQEAKNKILGNFILSQETNLEKASTIGWFETSGRGFDFQDKYEELINSVTASDIIKVANKYFNSNYVTSIVEAK